MQGIIYVMDTCFVESLEENRDRLHNFILCEESTRDIPILIYANKMDLPNAMTIPELSRGLGLLELRDRERKWII